MKKKMTLILIIICITYSCIGCIQISGVEHKTQIKKLAYDFKKSADHMVYIKENGTYEAYFVLSNDYYGKTLLMRYYLLDKARKFNIYEGNGACNAYYPNSLMDKFLSKDFYNSLSPKMKKIILDMDIDITTKESIDVGHILETEKLKRKIFLLSAYEVNARNHSLEAHEGIRLKYFSDSHTGKTKIAYIKDNTIEPYPYWLRTAHTWDDYTVTGVAYVHDKKKDEIRGMIVAPMVNIDSYVRPIFCVEGNTLVFKKDIGDKKLGKVYVIE